MTCETTGQDRNLPCHLPTPLRFRESIENIKMWTTRLTDRPTGIQSLLFFLCLNHSSSYLHPLTIIMIGRPTPSHPRAQPARFAVRLTRRRRTGRKWTLFFSALVCRLHTADCTKMVLFSVWWAGRKAVASSSGKQASAKFQVSSARGLQWF